MLSHTQIWSAIDRLADHNGLSVSALARTAGLDPTSFNRSKRKSADGRLRWPSTESLSRILSAMDCSLDRFIAMVEPPADGGSRKQTARDGSVPLLGFAQAGDGGFFDDGGYPAGFGWDLVELPSAGAKHTYALKVQGDSMLPLYRNGDTLIVEPEARVRPGDRVVVKTRQGEVMAKLLSRHTQQSVELQSLNPEHSNRSFDPDQIEWIARIVWASQ
jgi:phage repressor protein C with HTH and peptisase S24 domain